MKNKQKICFVIYSLSKGGAEKNVALLTKALSKYHDVHLVVFENKMTYSYDAKLHVIPAKASNKK